MYFGISRVRKISLLFSYSSVFKYLNNNIDINHGVTYMLIHIYTSVMNILYAHICLCALFKDKLMINWKRFSGARLLLCFSILNFSLLCLENIHLSLIIEESTELKIETSGKELSSWYLAIWFILYGWYIYNAMIQIHVAFNFFSENIRS